MLKQKNVFVSYSHKDEPFVNRLVEDLLVRGVNVWQDHRDIKAGDYWDEKIQAALESSRYFLVVLSPNSVASKTVQDETNLALDEEKVIVPILHKECDIPFRLRRVQYISFENDYADAFSKLVDELEHSGALNKWETNVSSSSIKKHIRTEEFQALIDDRTREFVGREFVFSEIDSILADATFPSGYIVIAGDPGIGKTSIIAQLVKDKGYIHHFNIISENIRSTRDFLDNVCSQLIDKFDLNYTALPESATQNPRILKELLVEAANKDNNKQVVILVDALDEADNDNLPESTNCLNLPSNLPKNVFFIVTTRKKKGYRLVVESQKLIHIKFDDPLNIGDAKKLIRYYLSTYAKQLYPRITEWETNETEFINTLVKKSQGNFMYLVHVLRDIREDKLTIAEIDNIHKLPQGLQAYYRLHWIRMGMAVKPLPSTKLKIIYALCEIKEPASLNLIGKMIKEDAVSVQQVIDDWQQFLHERVIGNQKRYSLYHSSFRDFLHEDAVVKAAGIDIPSINRLIAHNLLNELFGDENFS